MIIGIYIAWFSICDCIIINFLWGFKIAPIVFCVKSFVFYFIVIRSIKVAVVSCFIALSKCVICFFSMFFYAIVTTWKKNYEEYRRPVEFFQNLFSQDVTKLPKILDAIKQGKADASK